MIYRNYPYAVKATFISLFTELAGIFGACGAILLFMQGTAVSIIIAIVCLAVAGVCGWLFFAKVPKMAEAETEKNITTKPRVAAQYCSLHPDEFERVAAANKEFGEKYMLNEKNKVVKKK